MTRFPYKCPLCDKVGVPRCTLGDCCEECSNWLWQRAQSYQDWVKGQKAHGEWPRVDPDPPPPDPQNKR